VYRESNLIIFQHDATYSVHYISLGTSTCSGCWHPIIRSSYNCKYSFWYWLTGSTTIRSRCSVGTGIISNSTTKTDGIGCQHPKHVELPTEM